MRGQLQPVACTELFEVTAASGVPRRGAHPVIASSRAISCSLCAAGSHVLTTSRSRSVSVPGPVAPDGWWSSRRAVPASSRCISRREPEAAIRDDHRNLRCDFGAAWPSAVSEAPAWGQSAASRTLPSPARIDRSGWATLRWRSGEAVNRLGLSAGRHQQPDQRACRQGASAKPRSGEGPADARAVREMRRARHQRSRPSAGEGRAALLRLALTAEGGLALLARGPARRQVAARRLLAGDSFDFRAITPGE